MLSLVILLHANYTPLYLSVIPKKNATERHLLKYINILARHILSLNIRLYKLSKLTFSWLFISFLLVNPRGRVFFSTTPIRFVVSNSNQHECMAATILCVFYLASKDPYKMLMKYSETKQTEGLVSISLFFNWPFVSVGLLFHVDKKR
jgi:hypothetical protein